MKTELERLKVLSALKLGYGKLTAKNTSEAEFKNIEDAIEIVKNCYTPDVISSESELKCKCDLKVSTDYMMIGYTKCPECLNNL